MSKHRRWSDIIKAWADGAEVECKHIFVKDSHWGPWNEEESPIDWNSPDYIFRLKAEPVITTKYFQLIDYQGYACYMEFQPDLEKWDLKITYEDGRVIDTEHI